MARLRDFATKFSNGAGSKIPVATLALLLLAGEGTSAEREGESRSVEISGYVFGDAYWMASNHAPEVEDENGLWFRRFYLTFDKVLNDDLSVRLRFEGNSPGDFTTRERIEPYVKDMYLAWKVASGHSLLIGMSGTPTWGVVEELWGYRSVEKTLLDLQRIGNSRDIGVALKGGVGESGLIYHVMFGNGNGDRAETNSGKKIMAALAFEPTETLVIEAYADFDDRPGETNRRTFQGFAALSADRARVGLQAMRQTRDLGTADEFDLDMASAFAVWDVHPRASVLARVDRAFDPNPDGDSIDYIPFDPTAEFTFCLLGLDVKVHEDFNLIPNVEIVAYDEAEGGTRPDTDVIGRATFFFRF